MEENLNEYRVALLGIIVTDANSVDKLNTLLHENREYIISRMGVPYKQKGISIISVAVDAPIDVISALAGKIGMLEGVTSKAIYPKTE